MSLRLGAIGGDFYMGKPISAANHGPYRDETACREAGMTRLIWVQSNDEDAIEAIRRGRDGTIIRGSQRDEITMLPMRRDPRCGFCGRASQRDGHGACVGCGAA